MQFDPAKKDAQIRPPSRAFRPSNARVSPLENGQCSEHRTCRLPQNFELTRYISAYLIIFNYLNALVFTEYVPRRPLCPLSSGFVIVAGAIILRPVDSLVSIQLHLVAYTCLWSGTVCSRNPIRTRGRNLHDRSSSTVIIRLRMWMFSHGAHYADEKGVVVRVCVTTWRSPHIHALGCGSSLNFRRHASIW